MNGVSTGVISRNVPTVPGQSYILRFAYAGNPGGGPNPKTMQVSWGGNLLGTVSFDTTGHTYANMGWVYTNFTVIGTGNDVLQFASTVGSQYGPTLDAVSLTTSMVTNANSGDSLQFLNASNVIADHVSASCSANNLVSVLGSTNVTVQWSIMADSLYDTNNPHGFGSLLRYGSGALSFHHNLYADNYNGSPRLGDNISLDFVNNVIYNWGTNAGFSLDDSTNNLSGFMNQLNYVCNYLIAGSNSLMPTIAFVGGTTNTWIFQTNNFIDSNTNRILDGGNTQWAMFTNKYTKFGRPFPLVPVPTDEAFLAYEKVLDFAGPAMGQRDPVDTNIITKVRNQSGRLISTAGTLPALISTLPYLDTDQDGIPDYWEITFGENPTNVSNNLDRDGDGYTDLEEYLNWLAAPHALTVTNTPVSVDLMQLFGKTGNLSFSATNGVNGFVYLTNVLGSVTKTGPFSNSIAVFMPTNSAPGGTNFYGYAAFDVYVTNTDTVAYFGPVTVSVVVSAVPIAINSNVPPVIITLTNAIPYTNSNSGGSDYYKFIVTNSAAGSNAVAVLFDVLNPSANVTLVARYGLPLPSLSSYDYISANPGTANEHIVVLTNSTPVALTNGDWYLAVVNISGGPVTYAAKATELFSVVPPLFTYPTNNVFTNLETTPFTVTCLATDTNTPPLTLTFALVSGPTNITIGPASGVINWTPTEAQGPSTNLISVSVANAAFSVTNSFTIIVEESNLPPAFVLTNISDQIAVAGNPFVFTNAATDPDIPVNPLTYVLLVAPTSAVISTNGVITWTPVLAQVGTTNLFTTVVTDTNPWAVNTQSFSITNSFNVIVLFPPGLTNGLPLTNTVPGGGIAYYLVTVPINADFATNILLFATNLPVNLLFNQTNMPIGAGPGDFTLLSNVTNGIGSPVLGTNTAPPLLPGSTYYLGVHNTNSVAVTFALEVNFHLVPPPPPPPVIVISSIVYTNIGGTNGFLLTWFAPTNDLFKVQWTASLAPTSWQNFSNIVAYDLFISPTNSRFTFFDNGSQTGGFGPTRFYRLLLLVPNTLTLPPQSNLVVSVSSAVTVTNTATDSDTNAVLTYLLTSSPSGTLISSNGIITWMNATPSGIASRFTTLVTDNGVPSASATNTFTVFVAPFPAITNVIVTSTNVTLQWSAPTNYQFNVQWTTNLVPVVNWFTFPAIITSANGIFSFTDTNAPWLMKFYQLVLSP